MASKFNRELKDSVCRWSSLMRDCRPI